MTLQDWYLVAGIVVAVVAVITLCLKFLGKPSSPNSQRAEVSGQNSSITQSLNVSVGGKTDEE